MLQYTSYISIFIKNYNPERVSQIRDRINPTRSELTDDDRLHLQLEVKTVGSPEFPEFAKLIWWGNDGYCDLEFFVAESKLTYSSPTIYVESDMKIICRE